MTKSARCIASHIRTATCLPITVFQLCMGDTNKVKTACLKGRGFGPYLQTIKSLRPAAMPPRPAPGDSLATFGPLCRVVEPCRAAILARLFCLRRRAKTLPLPVGKSFIVRWGENPSIGIQKWGNGRSTAYARSPPFPRISLVP